MRIQGALILAVGTSAWALAGAGARSWAASSDGPCARGRLLIGALVPPEQRRTSDQIYTSVALTLRDAIDMTRRSVPCAEKFPFSSVDSYDELILRAQMKAQVAQHGYLESVSMSSVLGKLTGKDKLAGYVGIQVLSRETGAAAQFFIYRTVHGDLVPIRQKVITTDLGEDELLQMTAELGQRLAVDDNHPPTARLRGRTNLEMEADQDIVLNATGSSDPEFDKLSWLWHQMNIQPGFDLGVEGSDRSVLRLHPAKPGRYELCVQVTDWPNPFAPRANDCTGPSMQAVTLLVGRRPNLGPDVPLFEKTLPVSLPLDAECPDDQTCEWSQIGGPDLGPLAPSIATAGATRRTSVKPQIAIPGTYRIRLRSSNAFGAAQKVWTILAAPPPNVVWRVPTEVYVGYLGLLDASGTYDPLGKELSYLWTVDPVAPSDVGECKRATSPDETTYVTNPTRDRTTLQTTGLRRYRLALQVTAPREFDGRTVIATSTRSACVTVLPKRFELLAGGQSRWGGVPSSELSLGVVITGSVALGEAGFRVQVDQLVYRNVRSETGRPFQAKALGGTTFGLSYTHSLSAAYFVRPLAGGTVRGVGDDPFVAPRLALAFGNWVSGWCVMDVSIGLERGYHFDDGNWHWSGDLGLSIGATL